MVLKIYKESLIWFVQDYSSWKLLQDLARGLTLGMAGFNLVFLELEIDHRLVKPKHWKIDCGQSDETFLMPLGAY